jgi:indole-3-glycerol phosphate synthase
MSTFLATIEASTREAVQIRKRQTPVEKLKSSSQKKINFEEVLRSQTPAIIAEVKKQSPSLGELNLAADPAALAQSYIQHGASAVSILTESHYFKGSLDDLAQVRMINPDIPLLQKDFILDEYQLHEAKFLGADCILLIVALLGSAQTKALHARAIELGLSVLVEVHNESELEIALCLKKKIIGVNNRDLHTLKISLDVSRNLIKKVPKDVLVISESGITSSQEMQELSHLGLQGFLIGSSLMKEKSPGEKLASLIQGVKL